MTQSLKNQIFLLFDNINYLNFMSRTGFLNKKEDTAV